MDRNRTTKKIDENPAFLTFKQLENNNTYTQQTGNQFSKKINKNVQLNNENIQKQNVLLSAPQPQAIPTTDNQNNSSNAQQTSSQFSKKINKNVQLNNENIQKQNVLPSAPPLSDIITLESPRKKIYNHKIFESIDPNPTENRFEKSIINRPPKKIRDPGFLNTNNSVLKSHNSLVQKLAVPKDFVKELNGIAQPLSITHAEKSDAPKPLSYENEELEEVITFNEAQEKISFASAVNSIPELENPGAGEAKICIWNARHKGKSTNVLSGFRSGAPPDQERVGHVAIKTKDFYASLWPEKIKKAGSKGVIWSSYDKDIESEGSKPDLIISLSNLDTKKMHSYYQVMQKSVTDWKLLGPFMAPNNLKQYINHKSAAHHNCASLVHDLLAAGGIHKVLHRMSGIKKLKGIATSMIEWLHRHTFICNPDQIKRFVKTAARAQKAESIDWLVETNEKIPHSAAPTFTLNYRNSVILE